MLASVKPFVQHGRVSSKYFGERYSWPSHLQADLMAACQRDTNLEREVGYNHDKFVVSLLKHATVLGHVPQNFCGCFDTSSGTERPSLVKLLTEESVVKLLPSASSLCCLYYLTSSFVKGMRLTRDG